MEWGPRRRIHLKGSMGIDGKLFDSHSTFQFDDDTTLSTISPFSTAPRTGRVRTECGTRQNLPLQKTPGGLSNVFHVSTSMPARTITCPIP